MSARTSAFSESERAIPWGEQGGRSRNFHHPLCHPQRLVFGIEVFKCRTSLVVPPLVEPTSRRLVQAFDFGFQRWVPCELPLPPQPVLQASIVLNVGPYQRPLVVTRATFGKRCRQSRQDDVERVLIAGFDCHLVVKFGIGRNLISQLSSELDPVSALDIRVMRWVLEG